MGNTFNDSHLYLPRMTPLSLHQLLLAKLDVAKKFTKDFQSDTKQWIEDYKAETPKATTLQDITDKESRYQYTSPIIFDHVEKYRSSFFEKPPEVIYAKKGKDDESKAQKISAAWLYLKDVINFKQFMDDTYTYFGLCGFVSGHVGYKKSVKTVMDDEGVEYTKYLNDDPFLEVYDYENEWFMPDSHFSSDAKEVSYFRKKKMTLSEAYKTFGKELSADESIVSKDVDSEKESVKNELLRCGVYYYVGTLPKKLVFDFLQDQDGIAPQEDINDDPESKKEFEHVETDQILYAVFTKKELLTVSKSPIEETTCALGRWYSNPGEFFGYGLGKKLSENQKQESIRIGQLIRYADLYAFPKLALSAKDSGLDMKQIMQRNNPVIMFRDVAPSFISPPGSNGAINAMLGQNQSEIQTNSGLSDISKSQESTTVTTATGQTQLAESNEKRIKVAKEKYFEFLKQIIIKTFKYAQVEWEETKYQDVTDDEGETTQVELTKDDFNGIDFDRDISIDFENISVNKDVMRQQVIAMYDKMKDDPLVERSEVVKKVFRDGFGEKNPDQFIKKNDIQPGMKFQGEDGAFYVADESGRVVSQDAMDQVAPQSDGSMQPSSNEGSVLSSPMGQANAI